MLLHCKHCRGKPWILSIFGMQTTISIATVELLNFPVYDDAVKATFYLIFHTGMTVFTGCARGVSTVTPDYNYM